MGLQHSGEEFVDFLYSQNLCFWCFLLGANAGRKRPTGLTSFSKIKVQSR